MVPIRHTHASGRFTATPAQEEKALDDYMSNSDLVTVTEVDNNLKARCLREPGWTAVFGNKGSRDDCGIAVRDERFFVPASGTETLSPLRYKTERGVLSDTTEGAYAVIQDRKGFTGVGVVVVVHMPHNMQDELRAGTARSDVAKAYRDIMRGARKLANKLARKFKAQWRMIVGDWNINIKKIWVKPFLKLNFPRWSPNFEAPYPGKGTWGPLIFDFALLIGIAPTKNPTILARESGFDHVGWRQLLDRKG